MFLFLQRNYPFFISFISSSTFLCIYVFVLSWINILRQGGNLWRAMGHDIVSVILIVYCFVAVWFVGGLTVFHIYLICTNQVDLFAFLLLFFFPNHLSIMQFLVVWSLSFSYIKLRLSVSWMHCILNTVLQTSISILEKNDKGDNDTFIVLSSATVRIWVHFIKYDLDYAKYMFLDGLNKEKHPSFTMLSSATALLQSTLTFDLKILNWDGKLLVRVTRIDVLF